MANFYFRIDPYICMVSTLSEENYLKAIYALKRKGEEKVSVKNIALYMGNSPASVVDMLKKLSAKELVNYDKKSGADLSSAGYSAALGIIRKHRLWEVFLCEKLGYTWDKVHDIAEQLEHIKSEDLADKLSDYLGNPKFDPHGDPIPDKKGNIPKKDKVLLSKAEQGKSYRVVGVLDASTLFLEYLQKLKVNLGVMIQLEELNAFDGSMLVKINEGESQIVSLKFAQNIWVSPA
jgi:DtxR family transcriptional regulator, Mn-dependent transcriptional regulator